MNRRKLDAAMEAAHRFLAHAEHLMEQDDEDRAGFPRRYPFTGSRASGAVRRSSLDLTRALADLRKAG